MSDPNRLTYRDGENERIWLAAANSELRSLVLQLKTLLDELDALHQSRTVYDDTFCDHCNLDWPCPTHVILHPESQLDSAETH